MRILITGGKTATALKIIKAFEDSEILLGDYGDVPSIKTNSYRFVELGEWNKEILAHHLLTKCLDYSVDILLPLYEGEIEAVSKSLTLFGEFGLKVLMPENPQINRKKTSHWAIFENERPVYINAGFDIENKSCDNLNGVYHIDDETGKFYLASIPNPL